MHNQYSVDYYQNYYEKDGLTYWSGRSAPSFADVSSACLIDPSSALRERPSRHGKYDAVYFIEENLGNLPQWRLILDELLRLLRPGRKTLLIIKVTPIRMARAEFFSMLKRRDNILFIQKELPAGVQHTDLVVLECFRKDTQPRLDTLGFGIISDGSRPHRISQFVNSILQVKGIREIDWQIGLCGPRTLLDSIPEAISNQIFGQLVFVEEPSEWSSAGWITRKKNLLANNLCSENIVIVHDRYIVPHDFLERFYEFGADFDFVSPGQTRDGLRFPDWTATSTEWDSSRTYLLPYNASSRSIYINGGAVIAKRHVLVRSGWNELLFWDQCEDIELTRRLESLGVIARNAPSLRLEVTDARPGYEQAFERTKHDGSPVLAAKQVPQGLPIRLPGKTLSQLEDSGIIAWPSLWQTSKDGLVATERQVELVLCNVTGNPAHIHLTCKLALNANSPMQIHINGIYVSASYDGAVLTLPVSHVQKAAGRQLVVSFDNVDQLIISSIELGKAVEKVSYPVIMSRDNPVAESLLGIGWWKLETWGVWSEGTVSTLHLPAAFSGAMDIRLSLGIKTLPNLGQPKKTVGMSCNGIPIGYFSVISDGRERTYAVSIPSSAASQYSPMTISLSMLTASSPSESRHSNDQRMIGIGLTKVDIHPVSRRLWAFLLSSLTRLEQWVQKRRLISTFWARAQNRPVPVTPAASRSARNCSPGWPVEGCSGDGECSVDKLADCSEC